MITSDKAPAGGEFGDSSSCCGQSQFPNLPAPTSRALAARRGTVGALLLSPYIKGRASSPEPYDHFSLLRDDRGPVRRSAARLRGLPDGHTAGAVDLHGQGGSAPLARTAPRA